jgi:hypothetical protein
VNNFARAASTRKRHKSALKAAIRLPQDEGGKRFSQASRNQRQAGHIHG